MFCPECGKKNDDTSAKCAYCGADLVSNVPTGVSSTSGAMAVDFSAVKKKVTSLNKTQKIIIVCVLCLCVVIGVLFAVLSSMANPQKTVEKYFDAVSAEDWGGVYDCLYIDKSNELLSKDNFVKVMQNVSVDRITDFRIANEDADDNEEGTGKGLVKTYDVYYLSESGSEEDHTSVDLIKQPEKQFLFFNKYLVSPQDFITSYSVSVPVGTAVAINGVEQHPTEDSDSSYYEVNVEQLFMGTYTLTVTSPFTDPYTAQVNVADDDYTSIDADELTISTNTYDAMQEQTNQLLAQLYSNAASAKSTEYFETNTYVSVDQATEIMNRICGEYGGEKDVKITSFEVENAEYDVEPLEYDGYLPVCVAQYNYEYSCTSYNKYGEEVENEAKTGQTGYITVSFSVKDDGTIIPRDISNMSDSQMYYYN